MKTYDEIDKILCKYWHLGGGISFERDENGEMTFALCFGGILPYVVIMRKDSGYAVRTYKKCPKKYAHLVYET